MGPAEKDDPELDHVREDKDAHGHTVSFHLPRELSITLVAGCSVILRRRTIAWWLDLEKAIGVVRDLMPP